MSSSSILYNLEAFHTGPQSRSRRDNEFAGAGAGREKNQPPSAGRNLDCRNRNAGSRFQPGLRCRRTMGFPRPSQEGRAVMGSTVGPACQPAFAVGPTVVSSAAARLTGHLPSPAAAGGAEAGQRRRVRRAPHTRSFPGSVASAALSWAVTSVRQVAHRRRTTGGTVLLGCWQGTTTELRNALATSSDAFLLSKHITYSSTAASQGSVILLSLVNPNSSWDILSSSLKTAVPRYANGTSNLVPSAVYMAQWPLSATDEVVQHVVVSPVSVLTLCHFLANWASLLECIMTDSWFSGMVLGTWKALNVRVFGTPAILKPIIRGRQLSGDKAMSGNHSGLEVEHQTRTTVRAVELSRHRASILGPSFMELSIITSSSPPASSAPPDFASEPKLSELQPGKQTGDRNMVSAKKLVQMAKKWQRKAALARKRVTLAPAKEDEESPCSTSSVAGKGHCVVYSADGRRFEIPLAYLGTAIFGELLSLSQEEFGFDGEDGRITLPCEAAVMEYVMCLLRRNASEEVEAAFLSSIAMPCHCGNGLAQSMGVSQQVALPSF
ncbi:hypothetical protein U9M48_015073 [Paspalum notatum var. saurae]|uniref:Auxin-responsive protein SAUR36 n=1 Tax=Paspalum notatum var. saurae TaxID=547442 RepID=A0AAQ3T3H6_PASNO